MLISKETNVSPLATIHRFGYHRRVDFGFAVLRDVFAFDLRPLCAS